MPVKWKFYNKHARMQIVPELVIVYASYVEYKYTTEKSFANGPMLQPQDSYCNFVIKFFLSSF